MSVSDSLTGRIHSVETLGALDGPGLRVVVFLQGCGIRCQYCHNPDSWDLHGGYSVTPEEMAREILRYRGYAKGGVTFSGGEPLLQADFLSETIRLLKASDGTHCAIDTAGAVPLALCRAAVSAADLLLLDIKGFSDETSIRLTGASSDGAWDILEDCEKNQKPVWIRHVLVPGETLFGENEKEGEFAFKNPELIAGLRRLSGFRSVRRVEFLPYHKLGEFKWERLGVNCLLRDTPEPSPSQIEAAVRAAKEILPPDIVVL